MRDNRWLKNRLQMLWRRYFPDVHQLNPVFVRFGRLAKTRLGSIKLGRKRVNTFITITGYFRDETIPEFMVDAVLAHEMAHYAHGFNSPHTQQFHHPHRHRVVDQELTERGLGDIVGMQKRWLKEHWQEIILE